MSIKHLKPVKALLLIGVHLDTAAHEDDWIDVTITAYAPSQKRWILIPESHEDTQYGINQLDENHLEFQFGTTRQDSEGVSKPVTYRRVE